jgi:DNA polymerase-1
LQNIPVRTELGRLVREAFVPEKGYVYVAADYAQFELRLAAALAKDEPLIEDFNRGLDVHTKTASDVYGVPMDQVTKEQRNVAKVVNFGVLYGMGAMSLAKTLSISHAAAQEFINKYFELRAPIRKYLDRTLANAKENGYVETYFGRRRSASDLERGNQVMRAATERAILNMPIQGTEADLMKRAMINLDGKLVGLDAALVLQIHDSLMVECKAELADKVALLLREEMEGVMPELKVKLAVDVKVGKNWGEV